MKRNRRYLESIFGARLKIDGSVSATLASLATEAETSGGLLFSIAPGRADEVLPAFANAGEECWEIGSVVPEPVIRLLP
jgi:selenophosphate synthase